MDKVTLNTLCKMKDSSEKIVSLTAYDYSHGILASTNGVDVILVGDSLGMVSQGHTTTTPVTMDHMVYHTECVGRGNQKSFLMSDLPYMSYATEEQAIVNAARLMQAGADMVKMEGGSWLCSTVKKLSDRGVPTCLHLGLTPQSIAIFGGFKVQGKDEASANKLLEDAIALEKAGANIILLECIPASLAKKITNSVKVPVIGIGAGADTDGQILVLYDILNMIPGRKPRFVKNFMEDASCPQEAIANYSKEVKASIYPQPEHIYSGKNPNIT